jgi:hypothetical protein
MILIALFNYLAIMLADTIGLIASALLMYLFIWLPLYYLLGLHKRDAK